MPNIRTRECGNIEIPDTLFCFEFEGIAIRVNLVWDKFIDIEKSSASTSVF